MPAPLLLETDARPVTAVSVFQPYRRLAWPGQSVRMACLTAESEAAIRAEVGGRLQRKGDGWELVNRGEKKPVMPGDYIVRFGADRDFTDAVTAAYVSENYTRETEI